MDFSELDTERIVVLDYSFVFNLTGMKGFERLDIDTKSIMLHRSGVKIASVRYYNYRATLYSFDDVLIEEYYDTESKEIARICSADTNDLKKYIEQVNLADLLK